MKTENILKVVDNLSEKLNVTGDKLLSAYEGEAKVYTKAFWIYIWIALTFLALGGYMIYSGLTNDILISKDYWGKYTTSYTLQSLILMWSGALVVLVSVISLLVQIVNIQNYLEAKTAPKTWAVTRLMDTIFDN